MLGNIQAIESLIEVAKAASLPPVMSAYTSLIKAWGLRKSLVNVRRVLIEMVEDGVQPNQLHYRTAIVAHGQNLRPNEAQVSCSVATPQAQIWLTLLSNPSTRC